MLPAAGMTSHIHSEADLQAALAALTARDPRLSAVLKISGTPPLRRRDGGFAGLAAIIVSQQLSTASADAIWKTLTAAFDPFDPGALRRRAAPPPAGPGAPPAQIQN